VPDPYFPADPSVPPFFPPGAPFQAWTGTGVTTTAGGGGTVTEDASTPTAVTATGTSVTTASFTPPAGSLMVAIVSVGNASGSGTQTGSVTDSQTGTWALVKRQSGSGTACSEIWTRTATGGSLTVTLTGTSSGVQLAVRVTNGTGTGAIAGSAPTAYQAAITTTTTGSLVYGAVADEVGAVTLAANGSTSNIKATSDGTNGETYGAFKAAATTGTPGSITLGYSTTASNAAQIVLVEIKPPAGGGGTGTWQPAPRLIRRPAVPPVQRRPRGAKPVPAQVNPPYPLAPAASRLRGVRVLLEEQARRRGTVASPVPAQQPPAAPAWVPVLPQWRVSRAWQALRRNQRGDLYTPPQAVRALIPAYFYPTLGDWATLVTYPNQPAAMIVDIASGPGTSVNTDYQTWIPNAVRAGITCIAYVDLNYGTRPLGTSSDTASSNTVLGDINGWLTLYPSAGIGGFFFDRTASDTANLAFTTSAVSYARSKVQGGMVVTNHGTYPTEAGYIPLTDVALVFENDYQAGYQGVSIPSYAASYVAVNPPAKFMHLIYNVPTAEAMEVALGIAVRSNVGWFYATSSSATLNPLSTYWASRERFDLWTVTTRQDDGTARKSFRPAGGLWRPAARAPRGHASSPVPAQQAVTAPTWPPQPVAARAARAWTMLRRYQRGDTTAPIDQTAAPAGRPVRRVLPWQRRPKTPGVTPPQFNPPYPVQPATADRPRRTVAFLRRPRVSSVTPPQFNPPWLPVLVRGRRPTQLLVRRGFGDTAPPVDQASAPAPQRARRTVPALPRRAKTPGVTPPQFNPPWEPVVRSVRRAVPALARRGRAVFPVQPQTVFTNPPWQPVVLSARRAVGLLKRSRTASPVPAQQTVVPPAWVPAVVAGRPAKAWGMLRRGQRGDTLPPIDQTSPPQGRSRRVGVWQRRPRPTGVTPPQFNPPYPVAPVRARRPFGPGRRGRTAGPVPAQQPLTPSVWMPLPVQARMSRAWSVLRRSKPVTAAPAQAVPPPPAKTRRPVGQPRRPGITKPVPAQVNPPWKPIVAAPRLLAGLLPRRGKTATPAPAQQTIVPARVPAPVSPRRPIVARSRPRTVTPPPAQAAPPPRTSVGRRLVGWVRRTLLRQPPAPRTVAPINVRFAVTPARDTWTARTEQAAWDTRQARDDWTARTEQPGWDARPAVTPWVTRPDQQ